MSSKIIEVVCQCGQKIAKYEKVKSGFLMKMYLDKILIDYIGNLSGKKFELGDDIFCPKCNKRIATIKMIHGRLAAKINHGVVKKIST
ncbi:MAG: hypothetical protein PHG49_03895 [Candidatus Pacebacteria bacterium]|nr:hypothetical protein [Candidatus Paceibacterota bacterium]